MILMETAEYMLSLNYFELSEIYSVLICDIQQYNQSIRIFDFMKMLRKIVKYNI